MQHKPLMTLVTFISLTLATAGLALTNKEIERMQTAGMCTAAAEVGNELARLSGNAANFGVFKDAADADVQLLRSEPSSQAPFDESYNDFMKVFEEQPTMDGKALMLMPVLQRCAAKYNLG